MTVDDIKGKYATDAVLTLGKPVSKESAANGQKLFNAMKKAEIALVRAYKAYAAAEKAYADTTSTFTANAKERAVKLINMNS
jgi:HJR/Mrr/RecB family endonuclease